MAAHAHLKNEFMEDEKYHKVAQLYLHSNLYWQEIWLFVWSFL